MSTNNVKKTVLRALALSLSIHACFANAADFNDKDFPSQALGHGVYELAYDQGQHALYAASAPSFDKDKTAGLVFQLDAESLKINHKIATDRRTFAVALDEETIRCIWEMRWKVPSLCSIHAPIALSKPSS